MLFVDDELVEFKDPFVVLCAYTSELVVSGVTMHKIIMLQINLKIYDLFSSRLIIRLIYLNQTILSIAVIGRSVVHLIRLPP